MKIIVIGQSGSGKSTLARQIREITGYPLLPLDLLWHTTDYSTQAKQWFIQEQQSFMERNQSWIIEGNYASTLERRIKESDKVIWLQIPRYRAIYRVIIRSLKRKINKESRPDMPEAFSERFDKEYLGFLSFIWHFEETHEPEIQQLIQEANAQSKLIILTKKQEKQAFLMELTTNEQK
ncbi:MULTISPECIES: topology modulation protein [unclassified Enterococcus]|uniref:topology modulation protein n=1 Tax=unclassified Enterococcus TaxID=2608891 RepID=UPI0013ED46FA|nr:MULTISPECIES: topology modulation protein [unclassified Enterococcus]